MSAGGSGKAVQMERADEGTQISEGAANWGVGWVERGEVGIHGDGRCDLQHARPQPIPNPSTARTRDDMLRGHDHGRGLDHPDDVATTGPRYGHDGDVTIVLSQCRGDRPSTSTSCIGCRPYDLSRATRRPPAIENEGGEGVGPPPTLVVLELACENVRLAWSYD